MMDKENMFLAKKAFSRAQCNSGNVRAEVTLYDRCTVYTHTNDHLAYNHTTCTCILLIFPKINSLKTDRLYCNPFNVTFFIVRIIVNKN